MFSVYIAGDARLHLAGTGAALAMLIGGMAAALLGPLYVEGLVLGASPTTSCGSGRCRSRG